MKSESQTLEALRRDLEEVNRQCRHARNRGCSVEYLQRKFDARARLVSAIRRLESGSAPEPLSLEPLVEVAFRTTLEKKSDQELAEAVAELSTAKNSVAMPLMDRFLLREVSERLRWLAPISRRPGPKASA